MLKNLNWLFDFQKCNLKNIQQIKLLTNRSLIKLKEMLEWFLIVDYFQVGYYFIQNYLIKGKNEEKCCNFT